MLVSRRRFLFHSAIFLSGAALLSGGAEAAAVRPRTFTKNVPLSAADRTVLKLVEGYAGRVRLQGVSVLGKIRGGKRLRTRILAEIPSADALTQAVAQLDALGVTAFAEGSLLAFSFEGTEFTIENLLPADFEKKLGALLTRLGVTFAADGLTWDPDTLELSDPFGATVTDALKLIRPGSGLAQLFATLLAGYDQAEEAKLALGLSFKSFRQRVLSQPGRRSAASGEVLQQFIGELPDLTGILEPGALISFIASPLISGVLGKELGLPVGQVLAKFELLRLLNTYDVSEAAIYLTALIQDAIDFGTADVYGARLDPFRRTRFRQALVQTQAVRVN